MPSRCPHGFVIGQCHIDKCSDRGGMPYRGNAANNLTGVATDRLRIRLAYDAGSDEIGKAAWVGAMGTRGHDQQRSVIGEKK